MEEEELIFDLVAEECGVADLGKAGLEQEAGLRWEELKAEERTSYL